MRRPYFYHKWSVFLLVSHQTKVLKEKATWLNIFSGFSFGIAAFAYIFSAQLNGVITAFIYSQLCVIISTLGGIFFIGENKTKLELVETFVGLILIIIGAAIQWNTKTNEDFRWFILKSFCIYYQYHKSIMLSHFQVHILALFKNETYNESVFSRDYHLPRR